MDDMRQVNGTGSRTDSNGIERVRDIESLPPDALRCAARFFHTWDGPILKIAPSSDYPGATYIKESCMCSRTRARHVDNISGQDRCNPRYGGGIMVEAGTLDRRIAYLLWLRAQRRALMAAVPS